MNSICRICESTEIFVNLIENTNKILLKMLKTFAEIQFDPNDFLPKFICKKCLINLEFAYNFKKQCEYTDERLRKLLQAGESNNEENQNVYFVKSEDIQNFDVNFRNVAIVEGQENEEEQELDQETVIEYDSEGIGILEMNEMAFVECFPYNTEENTEVKEEAETRSDLTENHTDDEQNHFKSDMDENQIKNIDNIEALDKIPEVQINNATDPIDIVNEFVGEEHTIENQNPAQQIDEIHNQSQNTMKMKKNNKNLTTPQIKRKYKRKIENIFQTNKQYTCDTCNETFECFIKFNEHKKSHGNQRYQCTDCDKWFRQRCKLRVHKLIHQTQKQFSCNVCTRSYTKQCNLNRHISLYHNQEKNFACDKCGKCFGQLYTLKQHETVHIEDRQFQCDICHKSFKSNCRLIFHKKRHLPSYKRKSYYKWMKKTLPCQFCGKISNTLFIHQNHLRTHTGEKPYECLVCKKRFSTLSTFGKHKRIHTGERPYKCNQCHLSFRQNTHLQTHKLQHFTVKPKPHKCSVCLKSFTYKYNLTVHMRLHTGEKPYHCIQCPKKFSDLNGLKRHKLIHTKNSTEESTAINSTNEN